MDKNKRVKISIIIPVYNMSDFIGETLEQIEKQTIDTFEVIVIDDGSTDDTKDVILFISEKYDNIRYYYQKNQGSGVARNYGISVSMGEYISFLDADDRYSFDGALEYLYCSAKEKSAVMCGGKSDYLYENGPTNVGVRKENLIGNNEFIDAKEYPGLTGFWSFIYKKDFLLTNSVYFPNYIRGQDALFFLRALIAAKKVYKCDKIVHLYRKMHKKESYCAIKSEALCKCLADTLDLAIKSEFKVAADWIYDELDSAILGMLYKSVLDNSEIMEKVLGRLSYLGRKVRKDCDWPKNRQELLKIVDKYTREESDFIKELEEKSIYIYGAGSVARSIYKYYKDKNISILGFLVTDKNANSSNIDNINVMSLDEYMLNRNSDDLIVIATFREKQNQIEKELIDRTVLNYAKIDVRRFIILQKIIEL